MTQKVHNSPLVCVQGESATRGGTADETFYLKCLWFDLDFTGKHLKNPVEHEVCESTPAPV